MRKFPTILVCLALALLGLGAAQRLTVLTHDSFALPSELLAEFTARTGIQVVFLQGGDAGEVVNRAVLTKARPLADLLFGVDDSLLERVRSEGIFEPYASGELARVDGALLLDVGGLVTPVDVGYVLPNIDTAWFAERGLVLPAALEDL
ncbi:MAG TPA: ABC transporter substrate-binding protein, partial [Trueperaceae bacterium]|nr:ABC transporter substrate-binding protein [Trueperaceae bacterium]